MGEGKLNAGAARMLPSFQCSIRDARGGASAAWRARRDIDRRAGIVNRSAALD